MYYDTCLILGTIVTGGGFGGLLSHLRKPVDQMRKRSATEILFGVGAATVVPLFLKVTESQLLTELSVARSLWNLLFLFALCLLAGMSGPDFLQRLGKTALGQAAEARRVAEEARHEVEQVKFAVIAPDLTRSDVESPGAQDSVSPPPPDSEHEQIRRLMASPEGRFFTARRLAEQSGLKEHVVSDALDNLLAAGLVDRVESKGVAGWFLTPSGRAINKGKRA